MARKIMSKMLVLGIVLVLTLGMTSLAKADGPLFVNIVGQIYNSDGEPLADVAFSGTPVTVIVIDSVTGEEDSYSVPGGLQCNGESCWVILTIAGDAIKSDDRIRIKIDGAAWNDIDYYLADLEDEWDFDFEYHGGEYLHFRAKTLSEYPLNLKPIIALIFIILIILFGFVFLAAANKQKLNVVITGKERVTVKTSQGLRETWRYKYSYGEPKNLVELGEFRDDKNYPENSIIKISARKVVKNPDDSYGLYNPKPMDMTRLPKEKMPTQVDKEEIVDKRWFQGGALKLKKGQTMKSASRAQTHRLFTAFVYPFIILELIFGVGALFYEWLRFPPSLLILLINIIILIVAMIFQIGYFASSTKVEKPTVPPAAPPKPGESLEDWKPIAPAAEPEAKPDEKPEEKAEEVKPEEAIEKAPEKAPAEEAPAEPAVVAPPKKAAEKKNCPNCGQEIGADFVVCPFCGKDLK